MNTQWSQAPSPNCRDWDWAVGGVYAAWSHLEGGKRRWWFRRKKKKEQCLPSLARKLTSASPLFLVDKWNKFVIMIYCTYFQIGVENEE